MPGMNHIAVRDIRLSHPSKKSRKSGGRKKKGQNNESEEIVNKSAFSLKETTEGEPIFTDDDENSEGSVEQQEIKEEEMSDNERESSHFAMSSFFSPARSVDRSRSLAPPREVKEEEIDEEAPILDKIPAENSGMDDRFGNSLNAPPHNDHNYARIMVQSSEFLEDQMNFDDEKRRSSGDEESESASKKLRGTKRNDSVLECPECDFRTRRVNGWVCHLRNMHYTSLTLAGLALLCECGNESVSVAHSRKCDGNITVIRKKDGPIKRFGDARPTPQCVLCEAFPKSVRGYTHHLNIHHKSTLAQNGVYLKCSCGLEVRYNNPGLNHLKDCNRRQFTLHNVDEEATPLCVLCEAYPRTACGYALHLIVRHNSTLIQNGVYLLCSCGLEVRHYDANFKHLDKCDLRQFTLHKLGDE